jgi:hypothetical protein
VGADVVTLFKGEGLAGNTRVKSLANQIWRTLSSSDSLNSLNVTNLDCPCMIPDSSLRCAQILHRFDKVNDQTGFTWVSLALFRIRVWMPSALKSSRRESEMITSLCKFYVTTHNFLKCHLNAERSMSTVETDLF